MKKAKTVKKKKTLLDEARAETHLIELLYRFKIVDRETYDYFLANRISVIIGASIRKKKRPKPKRKNQSNDKKSN